MATSDDFSAATAEAAAVQARTRGTLIALLDRLADDLADRSVAADDVATVVGTLHRCWSARPASEIAPGLARFVHLVETAGPGARLRDLAARCASLRSD